MGVAVLIRQVSLGFVVVFVIVVIELRRIAEKGIVENVFRRPEHSRRLLDPFQRAFLGGLADAHHVQSVGGRGQLALLRAQISRGSGSGGRRGRSDGGRARAQRPRRGGVLTLRPAAGFTTPFPFGAAAFASRIRFDSAARFFPHDLTRFTDYGGAEPFGLFRRVILVLRHDFLLQLFLLTLEGVETLDHVTLLFVEDVFVVQRRLQQLGVLRDHRLQLQHEVAVVVLEPVVGGLERVVLDGDLVHLHVHLVVDALAVLKLALQFGMQDLQRMQFRLGR